MNKYMYMGARGNKKPITTLNAILLHQENEVYKQVIQECKIVIDTMSNQTLNQNAERRRFIYAEALMAISKLLDSAEHRATEVGRIVDEIGLE